MLVAIGHRHLPRHAQGARETALGKDKARVGQFLRELSGYISRHDSLIDGEVTMRGLL